MRELRLLIDEAKLGPDPLSRQRLLIRLAGFLTAHLDGTATEPDFNDFVDAGVVVTIDGYPAHIEVTPKERVMLPLWHAANTIRGWKEAEVGVKQRWFALAEEAAMSAIHLIQQGQNDSLLGDWPLDEFTNRVWALATAMYEQGITVEQTWFGQNFGFVVQALQARGLRVDELTSDQKP